MASEQDILSRVNQLITQNPIMIFSKTYCPYCNVVKELFKELGYSYFAIELDQIPEGEAIQSVLSSKIGQRTVPQVFVGGDLVGGCDDTQKANEDGVLAVLLESLNLAPSK